MPPSEPPKGTKSRRKPKPRAVQPPSSTARQNAAFGSRPARPLPKPPRAAPPRPAAPAYKPPAGDTKADVRAGDDFKKTAPYRGAVRVAYKSQPHAERKQIVARARKRVAAGTASREDRAILHYHDTAVAGSKRVARANKAFEALDPVNTAIRHGQGLKGTGETTREKTASITDAIIHPKSVTSAIRAVGDAASQGWKSIHTPKIVQNAPKDLAELAVTTPTSVVKLGQTAVTKPQKVPGMLVAPYKELVKHPKEFITEHPVSTALMLDPAVRVPGRAAGRAARLAGKQTLERPAAHFPGTNLTEKRTGSRDAVVRAVQSKRDKRQATTSEAHPDAPKPGTPEFREAVKKVNRVSQLQTRGATAGERAAATAARDRVLSKRNLRLGDDGRIEAQQVQVQRGPVMTEKHVNRRVDEFFDVARHEADRRMAQHTQKAHEQGLTGDALDEHLKHVAKGVRQRTQHDFAKEFGGKVYRSKEEATAAKEGLPFEGKVMKTGKGGYTVVPKFAAERLRHHTRVGKEGATPARIMRTSRRLFTRTVLPLNPRWLGGQAAESGFRAATSGAGPTSYLRGHLALRKLEAMDPEAAARARAQVNPGGLSRIAQEVTHKTLAEEYKGTALEGGAKALTRMGQVKPIRWARDQHAVATDFVFNTLNGKIIENTAQKAMLGRALRDSPLMDKHVVGLSKKAITEAAEGLKSTETQVQLARQVRRMYGKYTAFSPGMRSGIMHWTPFLPWMLNMTRFLGQTLPVDHPVMAGLLADIDAATEDWRKEHGLSLRAKHKPGFLLGAYPADELGVGGKDQVVRIGRYLPFAPADTLEPSTLTDQLLPQFSGAYKAAQGQNPITGKPKHGKFGKEPTPGEKWRDVGKQLGESMVPIIGQAERTIKEGPNRTYNPLAPTRAPKPAKRKKGKAGGSGYPGFGGGGSSGSGYAGF